MVTGRGRSAKCPTGPGVVALPPCLAWGPPCIPPRYGDDPYRRGDAWVWGGVRIAHFTHTRSPRRPRHKCRVGTCNKSRSVNFCYSPVVAYPWGFHKWMTAGGCSRDGFVCFMRAARRWRLDHICQEVTAALWKNEAASAPPPRVIAPILATTTRRTYQLI